MDGRGPRDDVIMRHDRRLDAHGEQIDRISLCLERLATLQESDARRLEAAEERLAALEDVPARKWDNATGYVLVAVLGLVMGILANHFGI